MLNYFQQNVRLLLRIWKLFLLLIKNLLQFVVLFTIAYIYMDSSSLV